MKDIKYIKKLLLLFVIICNCSLNLNAQNDTLSFEYIANNSISPNGRYVSFFKMYKQNNALVLLDTKTNNEMVLPNTSDKTFLSDTYFMGINKIKNIFYLVRLKSFELETIEGISHWEMINNNELLLYSKTNEELTLLNLKTAKKSNFTDVVEFGLNSLKDKIVIKNKNFEYRIIELKNLLVTHKFTTDVKLQHEKIIWNDYLSVPFVIGADEQDVYVFELKGNKIEKVFQHPLCFDDNRIRIDTFFSDLQFISASKIAIGLKSNIKKVTSEVNPEIWLGSYGGITPYNQQKLSYLAQLGVLDLKSNKLISYYNHKSPLVFKIDSFDNTIYEMDEFKNQDFKEYNPNVDYLKYDSLNNKHLVTQSKLLMNHFYNFSKLPFFLKFKDTTWQLIDKKTGIVKEMDDSVPTIFYEKYNMYSQIKEMPVNQRFVLDKKGNIIFKDLNDLFVYDYNKNKLKRLTHYKEAGKIAYLDKVNLQEMPKTSWAFNFENSLQEFKDLVISWHTDNYVWSGIDLLTDNNKQIPLVEDKAYYTQIKRSKDVITYLKEKSNQAPILYRFDIKTKKEHLIYKSNIWDTITPQNIYEYVEWDDQIQKGTKRGAVIRYPKGYDSNKKYPVIVTIYENKDYNQHHYFSPFKSSGMAFNPHHYTHDGYFVIEPDIKYEVAKAGESATNYVISAIEYLSKKIPIDKNNMGLIGHSFGGYETNFIITQTPIFKTAVSSAGVSNLISFYHNMNWESKRPDTWRMETDQPRLGKPFTDIPLDYLENSPIFHANKVTTPLLIWAGKADYHVNWSQSVEMFLALKRLKKDVNLILYEGVSHSIKDDENGKDASTRVKQWFDYYLKGNEMPLWLN